MIVKVLADNGNELFAIKTRQVTDVDCDSSNCNVNLVTQALNDAIWHHDIVQPRGFWFHARSILFKKMKWEGNEEFHRRREKARLWIALQR